MRALIVLVLLSATAFAGHVTVTKTEIKISEQIFFDVGKATIKKESFPILDLIAAAMTKNKKIGLVEIGVHTDARGNDDFNLEMSQKRADAIREYLVGKGIDAQRLRAKGYGESKPRDKGSNEAAWSRNRRTQFLILQTT